jgi:tetratricopeptide (TPR) repeat protein
LTAPAWADAVGARDEAKAHHELARVEFSKGEYREALSEFQKAYAIAPIPDLLYNIGLCQEELHELDAAVRSYERYLAVKPNAEERVELEAHVAVLKRSLAERKAPPPAETRVPSPSLTLTHDRTPAPSAPTPIYRRWWLWTGVGVIVAGAGIGLALGLTASPSPPALGFPGTTLQ